MFYIMIIILSASVLYLGYYVFYLRPTRLYKHFVNDYAYEKGILFDEYPFTISRIDISDKSYMLVKYPHVDYRGLDLHTYIDFYYHDEHVDTAKLSLEAVYDYGFFEDGFRIETFVIRFDKPYRKDLERYMRAVLQENREENKRLYKERKLQIQQKKDSYDGL